MSLILDALNRAERERNKSQAVPGLQTVHDPLPLSADVSRRKNYLLAVIILLGLFALIAAAYLVVNGRSDNSLTEKLSASTASADEAVTAEQRSSAQALESPPPAKIARPLTPEKSPSPAAADEQVGESSSTANELAALYANTRAENTRATAPTVVDPVENLYVAPEQRDVNPASFSVPVATQPVAVGPDAAPDPELHAGVSPVQLSTSSTAQNAAQNGRQNSAPEINQPHPEPAPITSASGKKRYDSLIDLPDLGDLASGFRTQIPSLNYVRHNFIGNGGNSVVINGKAYRAGETLAADLMLEEIFSDGVILRFKQTRFKLRALNSWINM